MLKKIMVFMMSIFIFITGKAPQMTHLRMPGNPYISGDGFRSMADHVFDETDASLNPNEVIYGDIVFVKSDMMLRFFKEIHAYINVAYILVTHNSDGAAPAEFIAYLDDSKILRWYGQNPTIQNHEKFEAIPIGVANRYVDPSRPQHILSFDAFRKQRSIEKIYLLGMNFVRSSFRARQEVYDIFIHQPYCQQVLTYDYSMYLVKMAQSKFIISPEGNGLDCHRTWEAIIAGAIPVLQTSPLDELLQELPVLVVQKWSDVDQVYLDNVYMSMQKNWENYNVQKVTYDYWYQRIKGYQKQFKK